MTEERKGREQVEGKSALKSIAFQGKSLINELEKVKGEKWIRWFNKNSWKSQSGNAANRRR